MSTVRRGGRPKIKPPKKHGADFSADKTWLALSKSIKEVQNHNAASLSFEENYRYAYNMVLYKKEEMLYNGVATLVAEHLDILANEKIVPQFPAGSIGETVQLKAQQGELLLKGLKEVWDDHESIMTKLGQLLKYMDRIYPEKAHVPTTWGKGLELFLRHIIKNPIKDHLVSAILEMIQCEREGHAINRSAVKGCVDVFLGLETDHGTVYKCDLEQQFLQSSEEFYKKEANDLLSSCDCPEYLRRVEARYETEDSRIHHYLSTQTSIALKQILTATLLTPNLSTVISMPNSGLDIMIDTNKLDDLARLYRLYLPVPSGLHVLKKALRESITRRGKELNDLSLGPAGNEGGGEDGQEEKDKGKDKGKAKARPVPGATPAIKWVQDVLDLKDKFDSVWKDAFKSDRDIEAALNEAFESFINLHPKSPEYTSLFIDDHLKRGIKGLTDAEVDAILDKTITVFRYLSDKDIFERYYKNHLAKRLLLKRSISDDAERGMLSKLKIESGMQFTSKLEGMFNDIKTSSDAMVGYQAYLGKHKAPTVDISVTVMTSTFWPYSPPAVAPIIPAILAESCKSYEGFYYSRHSGRRLTWLPSMGNADVRVAFNAKSHDLNVSTHALMILLLFEKLGDDDFLTYSEIKEATLIEETDLKRNLQSLACAKYKVMKKHPAGREISNDDSFSFNVDFTDKMQRIKISTVSSRPENNQERQETQGKIDEERKHQIDACVVRIMKDRKHMKHNELVNEVTRQLAARFAPDPLAIKKRIEALIEREYLERCEDRKSYNYLA